MKLYKYSTSNMTFSLVHVAVSGKVDTGRASEAEEAGSGQ